MNNRLRLNVSTTVLMILLFTILLNDYLVYFIPVIPYIIGIIISATVVGIIFFLLYKKDKIILRSDFSRVDFIFYLIILIIFFITSIFPDISFDTVNYHIYIQEHPFNEKIFGDFFAGKNLNSFSYAFPDRIHYLFRYLLGYRFGIIVNYLVFSVIYFQVKSILKNFIKDENGILISLFSIVSIFSFSIYELIDNYYIDLFSLVVLLEILRMILLENFTENNKYISIKIWYLAILFGFAIAIKISNAPILIFMLIYFFIKTRFSFKKVNIKDYFIIIMLGLVPFILYFIYSYKSTGNPVFPFYNTIFKSKYYTLTNWLDTRFGPTGIKETLIWPIKIVFAPNRGVDSALVEQMWMVGYILSYIMLLFQIFKYFRYRKINKKILEISIVTIIVSLIWSKFLLGYTRYGLIVLVLSFIIFFICFNYTLKEKKYLCFTMLLIFLISSFSFSFYHSFYSNEFWLVNNLFTQNKNSSIYQLRQSYKNNFKKTFDYNEKYELPDNSVWGVVYYNSGYITMINDNNPIINLTSGVVNEETNNVRNSLIQGKRIFTIVDVLNFDNFFKELNNSEYRIKRYHDSIFPKFMREKEQLYVFELEKKEYISSYELINTQVEREILSNSNKISFIYGLPYNLFTEMKEGYQLQIKLVNNKGKEDIIDVLDIDKNGKLVNYEKEYKFNAGDKIKISIIDKNKNNFPDDRWFMLVNYHVGG